MYIQTQNQKFVSQPSTCSSFPRKRESRQLEAFKRENFERLERIFPGELAKKTFPSRTETASINQNTTTNLKTMSNDQLLLQTKNLVQKERQINIQVLQHLQEIEKRKLYLKRGFSSLFEYAVKELGYSESSAYRRIKAMKLCKELPETKTQISTGKLNLCTASKLQTVFEKQEKQIKNKVREQQRIATKALLEKNKKIQSNHNLTKNDASIIHCEELLRHEAPIMNTGSCSGQLPELRHEVPISKAEKRDLINKVQGKSGRETEQLLSNTFPLICSEREKVREINKDKVEIKVILNKESQEKLEALKKLLSHKNPNMSYGELISLLAEMGLNKYDPKRKINKKNYSQSRVRRHDNNPTKVAASTNARMKPNAEVTTGAERRANTKMIKPQTASEQTTKQKINNNQKYLKHSRYIPSVVRHHVWMRDQGQCTYICPKTNRRCSSNHLLQIDHIKAFSRGGTNEPDNLRLLCANHNQFTFSRYQKYT